MDLFFTEGQSRPWSYGSWIDNYLCNQYLSPLTFLVWILLRRGVLNTMLCDNVCHWLAADRWFSPATPVSSTNKTDHHDIPEIFLKVALNVVILSFTGIFGWLINFINYVAEVFELTNNCAIIVNSSWSSFLILTLY